MTNSVRDRIGFIRLFIACALALLSSRAATIQYNRDIRPILSENCYQCHGPDKNHRKAGLRLDVKEEAFKILESGEHAIIAGDPDKSTVIHRITTTDEDDHMPPAKSGKKLTSAQIDTLKQWIKEGAEWQGHWAYQKVEKPTVPEVKKKEWARNEIDKFILARLEKEGLDPSSEADKITLIRRLSFDLVGLPPTIDEVDAFLADNTSESYEKLVDRLLNSPQFGERMAQHWLDLARYADTNGYHIDNHRDAWKWREWVINAFNKNKPFDEFTIEQLAGDLLENPTLEQRIATGFNRNGMHNFEGGADPDEYQSKYVVDRVATTANVFLGSTLACAECHDHKYDPFTTKDFYRFYAFFNTIPEQGLDGNTDNPRPFIRVPNEEQGAKLVELLAKIPEAEAVVNKRTEELNKAQLAWEKDIATKTNDYPDVTGILALFPFDDSIEPSAEARSQKAATYKGTTNAPTFQAGWINKSLRLERNETHIEAGNTGDFERNESFSISAWIKYEEKNGTIVSKMNDSGANQGWDFGLNDNRAWVHIINRWDTNAIKVLSKEKIPAGAWQHLLATYDGSSKAAGVKIYLNGKPLTIEVERDNLTASINTTAPFRIGRRESGGALKGNIDDLRLYTRALSPTEAAQLTARPIFLLAQLGREKQTDDQKKQLAAYYKDNFGDSLKSAESKLKDLREAKDKLYKEMPQALVMEEMENPRKTHILVRGDWRNKGEQVTPGIPAIFGTAGLPPGTNANRLTLAKWLVNRDQPLTPRVTVNRYWQMLFGTGLVKSANDFGSQGEWPSHPELLDWLAADFMDHGWNIKWTLKQMVMSTTYRQSAVVKPDILERDAYNKLLARGPRFRLDAEMIRDNALAVSGLLNEKIGGRSVYPYQPAGLWEAIGFGDSFSSQSYKQSHGPDLYRRGLYTYWKRSLHYPSFATFDAPNREVCTSQRARTTTPLQSLVLMNDPVYVEAARALGQRVLQSCKDRPIEDQITYAFRVTLSRKPKSEELSLLKNLYTDQLSRYQQNKEAATALLKVGESEKPKDLDDAQLAAWTALANVLFNLDETITKG
jgi:hypothetical protein